MNYSAPACLPRCLIAGELPSHLSRIPGAISGPSLPDEILAPDKSLKQFRYFRPV